MEGMEAFARRHFPTLPPERTHVINVDTVGSPHLLVLEGEGMLGMREYPKDFLALVERRAPSELGIYFCPTCACGTRPTAWSRCRPAIPTAALGSVDEYKIPTNYHWPTDTADNVHYGRSPTARGCARR